MSYHVEGQNPSPHSSSSGDASITLSTGAIAGIAVGGAVVLFAALAPLLIKLARRQDRRRASAFAPAPDAFEEVAAVETGPKRLRKKSLVSEPVVIDKEDDEVGREEGESRRSSLHVSSSASPSRTRQGSFSTAKDGSRRGSVDTAHAQNQIQTQKSRSPEKQRGYGMYQHRRKTSWIDEDALHGPTVTSPRRAKQKHKRRVSWFDGGLGRSLSRLSTRSGMGEVSPTLPYTETQEGAQFDAPAEGDGERGSREIAQGARFSGYATTPPRSSQQQQQVYTSPQRSYGPSNNPSPSSGSNNVSKSPPDIVHNPRYRDRVSFQAAQQLAGGARLPAPIGIPQGQIQRQPILKHSATETELAEILRMTAERLQDGNRSARRQTLMSPFSSVRLPSRRGVGAQDESYADFNYDSSDRGDVSPVKSHKSAPATMSYAELEGCTPRNQSPQKQLQTPRHSRHISHISEISQASMFSEPDSLVAPRRESVQEVRTALSSPSRVTRSNEPTPSPEGMKQSQQMRPFSNGSTLSSALSTLYSMEEASIRSPPAGELRVDTNVQRRTPEKVLSAFDIFNGNKRSPEENNQQSPKPRYEEIPSPLRICRGTVPPNATPASRPGSHLNTRSTGLPNSRMSFMIHAMDESEDPFTTVTTPQNLARLSKVFSPVPTQMPKELGPKPPMGGRPMPQDSQRVETPPSSPTRRGAMPSPRSIINSPSNQRAPSPVISEAGLSSVYDSYIYTHNEPYAETRTGSATGTTTESDDSEASTVKRVSSTSTSGRESRVEFRVPNYGRREEGRGAGMETRALPRSPIIIEPSSPLQPRRSMPSDGSIYSQDTTGTHSSTEDRVPPLRAATVKSSKSVRMSNTITELRRMNSQVSTMSDVSVASSTVAGMRGGGCSPGRQSGGGRNYLSLGGGLRNSGMYIQPGGSGVGETGASSNPSSPIRRGSMNRSRRGTVVMMQGLDARVSGNIGTSSMKRSSQLMTHATKLSREESASKRASVESLYDSKGFLKG